MGRVAARFGRKGDGGGNGFAPVTKDGVPSGVPRGVRDDGVKDPWPTPAPSESGEFDTGLAKLAPVIFVESGDSPGLSPVKEGERPLPNERLGEKEEGGIKCLTDGRRCLCLLQHQSSCWR